MTKTQKKQMAREIRAKGNPISKEDTDFMINEIFSMHPEWEKKKGAGISKLFVGPDRSGNICYYIERKDDTTVPISFLAALAPLNKERAVKSVLRAIIEPQIDMFRETVDPLLDVCGITGEELGEKFHIDHEIPFNDIANEWLADKNIDELYAISVRVKNPKRIGDHTFSDNALVKDWYDFHEKKAILRPAIPKANLKRKRK